MIRFYRPRLTDRNDSNYRYHRQDSGVQPRSGVGPGGPRLHLFGAGPRRPGEALGRALPVPPPGSSRNSGRHEVGPGQRRRRPPARRHRRHIRQQGGHRGDVRKERRPHRGRRHQAEQDGLQEHQGAPGGKFPEDDPGHGRRHPGHFHQAGRPSAQHAHPAIPQDRGVEAQDRPGNHGHLRPPGRPTGHLLDQEGAGGDLVQVHPSGRIREDQEPGRQGPGRTRKIRGGNQEDHRRKNGDGGHPVRGAGKVQAVLEHLQQDADPEPDLRRRPRPGGVQNHR